MSADATEYQEPKREDRDSISEAIETGFEDNSNMKVFCLFSFVSAVHRDG